MSAVHNTRYGTPFNDAPSSRLILTVQPFTQVAQMKSTLVGGTNSMVGERLELLLAARAIACHMLSECRNI